MIELKIALMAVLISVLLLSVYFTARPDQPVIRRRK
jgi:hypothetical protein